MKHSSIEQVDKQITQLFALHPEHDLFDSLPGAGPVLGPRLLTVFGAYRMHWASAMEIESHSGIAPITERSGTTMQQKQFKSWALI